MSEDYEKVQQAYAELRKRTDEKSAVPRAVELNPVGEHPGAGGNYSKLQYHSVRTLLSRLVGSFFEVQTFPRR